MLNITQFALTFRHKVYHLFYQLQVDVLQPNALIQAASNKKIIVQSDRDGEQDIFLVAFNGGGTPASFTNLTTDLEGDSRFPVWQPQGEWIAFEHDDMVYIMRADGDGKQALVSGGSPTWSPDGTKLFFTRFYTGETMNGVQQRGDIYAYDIRAKTETLIMNVGRCNCYAYEQGVTIFSNWQPSADGTRALFQFQNNSWFSAIYQWDGTQATMLENQIGYRFSQAGIDPVWSPSGVSTYGLGFAYQPVIQNGNVAVPGGSPSWSPDGAYILYDGLSSDGWLINIMPVDLSTSPRSLLFEQGVNYAHPSWRP